MKERHRLYQFPEPYTFYISNPDCT